MILACEVLDHKYSHDGIENGRRIDLALEMAGFRGRACLRCGHVDIYLSGQHTAKEF